MQVTLHLTAARVSIDFDEQPSAASASQGREFFRQALAPLLGDEDLCFTVALVAHELTENIIKYSVDGERSISVGVDEKNEARRVWVRSVNRVSPQDVEALVAALETIRTTDAPDALYDRIISESASRLGSGLGLIRIRAETDMQLDYEVQGNLVEIEVWRALAA